MTEWRPMSEAPRDETRVLLAIREGTASERVIIAAWQPRAYPDGCWSTDHYSMDDGYSHPETDALGWMPLPVPPAEIVV